MQPEFTSTRSAGFSVFIQPLTWGPSFSVFGIPSARLTLSFDGGLILVAGGAIMGLRIGLSILLGALLNFAVFAPILIHKGVITHSPPRITSTKEISLPLTVEGGTFVTVHFSERGEAPRPLTYTWKETTTYENLDSLASDLNAPMLSDGRVNPMAGIVR